jgi:hypothetical protein
VVIEVPSDRFEPLPCAQPFQMTCGFSGHQIPRSRVTLDEKDVGIGIGTFNKNSVIAQSKHDPPPMVQELLIDLLVLAGSIPIDNPAFMIRIEMLCSGLFLVAVTAPQA